MKEAAEGQGVTPADTPLSRGGGAKDALLRGSTCGDGPM